jgi:hypothetical protein
VRQPTLSPLVVFSTSDFISSDYSNEEKQEMRDLVLSLSLESTDEDRRTRLKDIFHEALARPNGAPKRFSDLFDTLLAKVGAEVQDEAKKRFFEAQAAKQEQVENVTEVLSDDAVDDNEEEAGEKVKSPDELQLWALVDMMVQSKTIVKRENGDLGSKGTFQ